MTRCTVLQHDIELYGWSVVWEFATVLTDHVLNGTYRIAWGDDPCKEE